MTTSGIPHLDDLAELRRVLRVWREAGDTVALVPTMGALHEGHLTLMRRAKSHAGRVVVSIFVNPAQFAPHEDFDRYPRDLESDIVKLQTVGCDLVWAPGRHAMYPEGFATRIVPQGAAEGLESDFRPHFFAGVATVCCKLFNQVAPDYALFGEKDYQQLCVVRQMVRDLDLPLEIVALPTVREPDGLALSSRNRYLTPEERKIAPALHRAIERLADQAAREPGADLAALSSATQDRIRAAGFATVDYVEVRDAITLVTPADRTQPLRVLAAAWLGKTRLIDNVPVSRSPSLR